MTALLNPRLVAILATIAVFVGAYWYVSHLNGTIDDLQETNANLVIANGALKAVIDNIAVEKGALENRIAEAEETNKKIASDLAKAKGRIRYIKVPTECEPALNWLTEEVAK